MVIPTRNRSRLLSQTLASVCTQIGVDFEVVVVDDGCTDNTIEMISALGDARISVVRHSQARGVSAARNQGIDAATGEWIAFLDDDDLWSPWKLSRQLSAAQRTGRQWACSGSITIADNRRIVAGTEPPTAEEIAKALPLRNCVPAGASNVLVHRDALRAAGEFDARLRHMADWDMWIRLGVLGMPAVVVEPDVAYRLHSGNASADASAIENELAVIEQRYVVLRNGAAIDRAFALRWAAWNLLRVGRRVAAVRAYGHAVVSGDKGSLVRAIAAVVDPGVVGRTLKQSREQGWADRAGLWLKELDL